MERRTVPPWRAGRLDQLPPYLFVEMDRKTQAAVAAGKDVISFGIGDPDRPTPSFIVEALATAARHAAHHRYPPGAGSTAFRESCAGHMKRRFGVSIDPVDQVTMVIGTKEGIGHLPLAVVNPGETVIVPEPGYPVYTASAVFAGAVIHRLALSPDSDWLPDWDTIPDDVAQSSALAFLNYPNNPTGATATLADLEQAVRFGRKHDVLIAHDAAYADVYFDSAPPSILQVDGAIEHAIEFHSLSKSFNMTGWRIGFAAGNARVIRSLAALKNNLDSGQFGAIQVAAVEALRNADHADVQAMKAVYRERRDIVVDALLGMGIMVTRPSAGFYIWGRCPAGCDSMEFCSRVLDETGVVLIPGVGFGRSGEGFFRLALTVSADRTREAMDRLGRMAW